MLSCYVIKTSSSLLKYIYFYVDHKCKIACVRTRAHKLYSYIMPVYMLPAVSDHWEMAGDATAGSMDATPINFFKF